MASLYIKDGETAALAAELAERLKTTKTDVVKDALRRRKAELTKEDARDGNDFLEWIKRRRRDHPLPPRTGLKADKAFFDAMWDEL